MHAIADYQHHFAPARTSIELRSNLMNDALPRLVTCKTKMAHLVTERFREQHLPVNTVRLHVLTI